MAITLDGIKISSMSIATNDKDGLTISGNYSLMSNTGMVVAKQSFNDYGGMTVNLSPATSKMLHELRAAIQTDITNTLGL